MQLRNRVLTAGCVLCLVALTVAPSAPPIARQLASGALPTALLQESRQPDPAAPAQPDTKAVVVTGTIVRNGGDYLLRDSSGTVFRLDAPEKAQPFEGKSVKVTGKVEAKTNLLHVDAIQPLNA